MNLMEKFIVDTTNYTGQRTKQNLEKKLILIHIFQISTGFSTVIYLTTGLELNHHLATKLFSCIPVFDEYRLPNPEILKYSTTS